MKEENGILVSETSGSSGLPLRCPRSQADRLAIGVGIWRQRRKIDPAARPGNMYRFIHFGVELPRYDAFAVQPDVILPLYADLARSGCRWLHASPSLLLRHIEILDRFGGIPALPHLQYIECTSEFLQPDIKSLLEHRFSARVVDQYGMMETWAIALRCDHGFHYVNAHNVHVEILNQDNSPCPPGVAGQIVVTTLQQRLFPFTRYVSNDYGMWVDPRCNCRLGGEAFVLLPGRSNELIAGCTPIVFGNVVFGDAIRRAHRLHDLDDLRHIRVFQRRELLFSVHTNTIVNAEALCDVLREAVSSRLGKRVEICHVTVSEDVMNEERKGKPWLFRGSLG